jgi:HAD superfamily hydrolase (TIGR01509 family)
MHRLPTEPPFAIAFDMDGVLLDSERLDRHIWRSVAATYGLEFPDTLHDRMIGRTDTENLLRSHFGTRFELARGAADEMWRKTLSQGGVPQKTGVAALLEFLEAAGIPKAIATSTERGTALRFLGSLAGRFEALACGDEVRLRKPAPDVYLLAASRLGMHPRDCIAIEDSPIGYAAAEAAGMRAILIPDLLLPATPPRFACNTLLDVLEWLRAV